MEKMQFQANYKKYLLYYTPEQKRKIDYMNDWKHQIDWLKYKIKNNLVKDSNNQTSYIASAIDNYCFFVKKLCDNQFIIQDGYSYK